uniref:Amine oxidase domain-containing protein n=1 Tax=Timema bartmani TaxID=61472 RepID=A0A7R9FCT2_9NEOP|nr:unnamed protein product [Timema bartmani]
MDKNNKSDLTICPTIGTSLIEPCILDPCIPKPCVTIIGAGLAGLSAAHRLTKCGIKNVTVLEATERYRSMCFLSLGDLAAAIQSFWLNDSSMELGAQWIHGACASNPVFTLAAQEGLLRPPLGLSNNSTGYFYTTDGRAVSPAVSIAAKKAFHRIKNLAINRFASNDNARQHMSLAEFLASQMDQELSRFPDIHRDDASRHGKEDDLYLVSADYYGSFISIPGGNVRVPLGHAGIMAPLLRDLPECCVKYCTPVKSIMWDAEETAGPRAKVHCFNGEEYPCDYVIVTTSLGVLKNTAKQLFCPELPENKQIAIDRLDDTMRLGWSTDELAMRFDWSKGITHIEPVVGSKHVLCAWIGGPDSAIMETCSDENVAEKLTKTIRKFTGNPCLPYPSTISRSTWCTNPYFCGAFSYMSISSTLGHKLELGTPIPGECGEVPPIILFAGEATLPGYHGTTQGAFVSGVKEADRIIKLTKKYQGPPNFKNLKYT